MGAKKNRTSLRGEVKSSFVSFSDGGYVRSANNSASRSPLKGDNAEGNSPKSMRIIPNPATSVNDDEPKTIRATA